MIKKSDLVDAINDLSHDLLSLSIKVSDLEKKVSAIRPSTCSVHCSKKAAKAATQPRDKSGKFAKK